MAIKIIPAPVTAKTHQLSEVRYTKSCNQLFIAHQASGNAIRKATNTKAMKSFDNNVTNCVTDAPNTLRTPISLVRVLVIYMTKAQQTKATDKNAKSRRPF